MVKDSIRKTELRHLEHHRAVGQGQNNRDPAETPEHRRAVCQGQKRRSLDTRSTIERLVRDRPVETELRHQEHHRAVGQGQNSKEGAEIPWTLSSSLPS